MGMYTGLRFKADLSEKGLEAATSVIETHGWYVAAEILPAIKSWLQVGRRDMIPFGAVCYMPADWENLLGIEDGVWSVCCSLKNYESEIQTFLIDVLPYLVSGPVEVEYLYEESSEPSRRRIQPWQEN